MSATNNVVVLAKEFKDIPVEDLREGIECYSQTERQIDALKGGVAAWLFTVAHYVWMENDMLAAPALKAFTTKLEAEVEYITSPLAGGNQLSPSQAKLTGRNSLASAYKKIKNGFDKDLDLNDFPSCSALAEECAKRNKAEKEAEKAAQTMSQIPAAAKKVLKAQGVDVESEAGMKLLADKIKEMTKKVMEKDSIDGDKPIQNIADAKPVEDPYSYITHEIPQDLLPQASLIFKAIEAMADDLIYLLIEKTRIMGGETLEEKGNAAVTQVLQGMESKRVKWHDQALGHYKTALKKGFVLDEEVDEAV